MCNLEMQVMLNFQYSITRISFTVHLKFCFVKNSGWQIQRNPGTSTELHLSCEELRNRYQHEWRDWCTDTVCTETDDQLWRRLSQQPTNCWWYAMSNCKWKQFWQNIEIVYFTYLEFTQFVVFWLNICCSDSSFKAKLSHEAACINSWYICGSNLTSVHQRAWQSATRGAFQ